MNYVHNYFNRLYSSHTDFIGGFGFFDISISLTEEGLEKIDEIVEYIFQVRSTSKLDPIFIMKTTTSIAVYQNAAREKT